MKDGSCTILLFHSVDDRPLLSLRDLGNVHPDLFEKVLVSLRGEFDIVSLEEAVRFVSGLKEGNDRLMAITFDDGARSYAANALPVMESLGVPSTCFLITDCIGDESIYWRYLYNFCVQSGKAEELSHIVEEVYGGPVSGDVMRHTRNIYGYKKTEIIMSRIFRELFPEEEYREREGSLFLSRGQISGLATNALVRFGLHTRTHPVMSRLSDDEVREEIRSSLCMYRDIVGDETPMFSVPFGRLYRDYDERTVTAALGLSIPVILSAYGGANAPGRPLYNIRRIPVHEGLLRDGMGCFIRMIRNAALPEEYAGGEKRLDLCAAAGLP